MAIIIEHSPVVVAKHISGKLMTIDQVDKGLACECYCPECGAPLIAKKGEKVQHHFSHKSHDNDEINFETCSYDFWRSLHLLSFKALKDNGSFRMPEISAVYSETFLNDVYEEQTVLVPGQDVKFDSIEYDYLYPGSQLKTIIAYVGDFKFLICPLFSKEKNSLFNSYEQTALKGKGEIPVVLIDMEGIKEDIYPTETEKFYHYVITGADRHWSSHGAKVKFKQQQIKDVVCERINRDKAKYMQVVRSLEMQLVMNDFKIYEQRVSTKRFTPVNKFGYMMFSDFEEKNTKQQRHLLFAKREDGFNVYITISTDKINPPYVHAKDEDVCIWLSIPDAWRINEEVGDLREIKLEFYRPFRKTKKKD